MVVITRLQSRLSHDIGSTPTKRAQVAGSRVGRRGSSRGPAGVCRQTEPLVHHDSTMVMATLSGVSDKDRALMY